MDKEISNAKSKELVCGLKFNPDFDTVLLIVRHGESIGNARREFLGHTNKDLSELGYKQAEKTAEYLSEIKIDAVYSSDLIRAHNTALPHAKLRNLAVNDSEALREIYAGEWEGKSVERILEEYPNYFYDVWRAKFGECTIPGGESVPHLRDRIYTEVLKIAVENKGKTVLIGCHAAAIRSFWGRITKTHPSLVASEIPFPVNASVSVVYYDGKDLIPGEYSHDDHLMDLTV